MISSRDCAGLTLKSEVFDAVELDFLLITMLLLRLLGLLGQLSVNDNLLLDRLLIAAA